MPTAIHSATDVVVLKKDMMRIGCAILSEQLGIPAGLIPGDGEEFNAAEIRERLLTWAKAELMTRINDEIAVSVQELIDAGGLEEVAADMNSRLETLQSVEIGYPFNPSYGIRG